MTITAKLYQKIARDITAAIRDGRFAPGSRLPSERDLADELKVSRPTIREAMIALEMQGLVAARQGSGIYVTLSPATDDAQAELDVGAFELIEARTLFEGEAAALAATAIGEAALVELHGLLRTMERRSESREAYDADRRFHLLIATATGNSLIRSAIETLWDIRERSPLCIRMFAQARREGVMPRVNEHRRILDALVAHDPQAARQAMQGHLRRVTTDLLAATRLAPMAPAQADPARGHGPMN